MLECGIAQGLPGSSFRCQQIETLWSRKLDDLHINTPRSEKAKWRDWPLFGVGEGGSFFARALEHVPEEQFLFILAEWLPPRLHNASASAISKAERRDIVNSAISKWRTLMTRSELRATSPLPSAVYGTSLNNSRVRISTNRVIRLDIELQMGISVLSHWSAQKQQCPKTRMMRDTSGCE